MNGSTQFRIGREHALAGEPNKGENYGARGTFRREDYEEGYADGMAILNAFNSRRVA